MPTHGKARQDTIRALTNREPFKRSGFAMTAISGSADVTGMLSGRALAEYMIDSPEITYTVLSYNTPIAWVLRNGIVKIPAARYSVTTSNHQGMCQAHLARYGYIQI